MDVDTSSSDSNHSDVGVLRPPGFAPSLKRSNSAPMINAIGLEHSSLEGESFPLSAFHRIRRFSATCDTTSPSPPIRVPSRVSQIKQEEGMDVMNTREVRHEREFRSAVEMSRSWDELRLDETANAEKKSKPITEPLALHITPWPHASTSSSPSPTRGIGKQCFSPSMGARIRTSSYSPSPSPSPTRKSFTRRSLSPIAIRPSSLAAVKRKFDSDTEDPRNYMSPPKKFNSAVSMTERDRVLIIPHPLTHSLSSSSGSMEEDSPEPRLPLQRHSTHNSSDVPTSWLEDTPCTRDSWDKSDIATTTTTIAQSLALSVPSPMTHAPSSDSYAAQPPPASFPSQLPVAGSAAAQQPLTLQQKLGFSPPPSSNTERAHAPTQVPSFCVASPANHGSHAHTCMTTTGSQSCTEPTPMLMDAQPASSQGPQGPVASFSAVLHNSGGQTESSFPFQPVS
ncbi:PREDICTED: mucin-5AC-like isoform X1 [Priapulus caudatus]|uniref:Mucin-5AC-like isoform X1 n=1 Tax=Priapulus caudatus TaxID=37621 RepID=A0ABM1E6D1_PRICU|nr:PREDICTED: mucin-5AC-like isoform X1 [Priapulus caudatus]